MFRTAAVCQPSINQLGVITPPIHTWIAFSPSYFLFYDSFLGTPKTKVECCAPLQLAWKNILTVCVCFSLRLFWFPFIAINSVSFTFLFLSFVWFFIFYFISFLLFYSLVLFFLRNRIFRLINISFCACKCRRLNCCVFSKHGFILRRTDLQLTDAWKCVL